MLMIRVLYKPGLSCECRSCRSWSKQEKKKVRVSCETKFYLTSNCLSTVLPVHNAGVGFQKESTRVASVLCNKTGMYVFSKLILSTPFCLINLEVMKKTSNLPSKWKRKNRTVLRYTATNVSTIWFLSHSTIPLGIVVVLLSFCYLSVAIFSESLEHAIIERERNQEN